MKKTTTKKPAAAPRSPAFKTEPKGTAVVSVHPNLIAYETSDGAKGSSTVNADDPADTEKKVLSLLDGYTVTLHRHDMSGRLIKPQPTK